MGFCGDRWGSVEIGGVLWRYVGFCGDRWGSVEIGGVLWR